MKIYTETARIYHLKAVSLQVRVETVKHSHRQVFWLGFHAFAAFQDRQDLFPVAYLHRLPLTAAAPRGIFTRFLIKSAPVGTDTCY